MLLLLFFVMKELIVPSEMYVSSASHELSFDSVLACLDKKVPGKSLALITAKELALARMYAGKDTDVYYYGTWTNNSYVYGPGDFLFITCGRANNFVVERAEAIQRAYEQNREAYLDPAIMSRLELLAQDDPEDAFQTGVLRVHRSVVPSEFKATQLGKDVLSYFLFGGEIIARQYGAYLISHDKKTISHSLVHPDHAHDAKHRGLSFARPLHIEGFSMGFCMSAEYTGFSNPNARGRVFGVYFSHHKNDSSA